MPIDPSIPLSVQSPKIASPFDLIGQFQQLRNQQQESQVRDQELQLGAMKLDSAKRAQVEDDRLRQLFQKPDPSFGEIASVVGPARATEISKMLASLKVENEKAFGSHQQMLAAQLGGVLAMPEGLRPEGYTAVRANLIQRGLATEQDLPAQFDPAFVQRVHVAAMTPEQQQGVLTPKLTEHDPTKDLIDPTGAVVKPGTGPKPPNSQESDFLLNGKVVKGDYVPGTAGTGGKYFYNGQDVTGQVQAKPPAAAQGLATGAVSDVKESVAGMKDGTIPPQLPGRASKEYVALMAEAHRQHYDLAGAATDWAATQKHIATMNGQQQLRLNQSINALPDLLDSVDALAAKWKGGRFPILNKANLALAKNGVYGPDVASVAVQLDAQIADITSDLGNVYMGGNSPTDHALGLAAKSFNANWDGRVLHDMVTLARGNVQIRKNSINNTGVAGASATNPYAPPPPAAAPTAPIKVGGFTVTVK